LQGKKETGSKNSEKGKRQWASERGRVYQERGNFPPEKDRLLKIKENAGLKKKKKKKEKDSSIKRAPTQEGDATSQNRKGVPNRNKKDSLRLNKRDHPLNLIKRCAGYHEQRN